MMTISDLNGFAVDLGGTKTAAARIRNGTIVERNQIPTERYATPDKQVAAMGNLLDRLGYQRGDTLGVAVTGRVDSSGVWHAVNRQTLAKIGSVGIGQKINSVIGSASVTNDAAAATLAEATLGSGVGFENFGYITVSTGVGGGLVLCRRLHQSINGLAGHVGFSSSSHAHEMCGSGRHGTVESIASGNAIARAAIKAGYKGLDVRAVFEQAALGEDWAETIVETSANAVANLCADLATILGLQAVALGGSIGMATGYMERVRAHLKQLPNIFQPKLVRSTLGSDGPLLGALLQETGKY
jgi:N-acylmannosamine kinase